MYIAYVLAAFADIRNFIVQIDINPPLIGIYVSVVSLFSFRPLTLTHGSSWGDSEDTIKDPHFGVKSDICD